MCWAMRCGTAIACLCLFALCATVSKNRAWTLVTNDLKMKISFKALAFLLGLVWLLNAWAMSLVFRAWCFHGNVTGDNGEFGSKLQYSTPLWHFKTFHSQQHRKDHRGLNMMSAFRTNSRALNDFPNNFCRALVQVRWLDSLGSELGVGAPNHVPQAVGRCGSGFGQAIHGGNHQRKWSETICWDSCSVGMSVVFSTVKRIPCNCMMVLFCHVFVATKIKKIRSKLYNVYYIVILATSCGYICAHKRNVVFWTVHVCVMYA